MNITAGLASLKESRLYAAHLKALLWRHIMRVTRKVGKPGLAFRALRNQPGFSRMARADRAVLDRVRRKYEGEYALQTNPLISVVIPTYNRGKLLCERTLPAILSQTYENFEVVIVGDHCTDDTAERIAKVADARVRFHNLPQRPIYPADEKKRWQIAGVHAINLAYKMARGPWIAYSDDDDVCTCDHFEKLLVCAQAGNFEFVSGRGRIEVRPGEWLEKGSRLYRRGPICSRDVGPVIHSSVLYRSYLNFIMLECEKCLEFGLNGDAFEMRRLFNAGVRAGFVNEVVTYQPLRPGQVKRISVHSVE